MSDRKESLSYRFRMRFRCARCGKFRIRGKYYDLCKECNREVLDKEMNK